MNVDILIHGSPCQDFSTAGLNDLSTGRSILYERTLEIIEKLLNPRPKYVVWENVVGLLNKNNIKHFNHYLNAMEKMGYKSYYDRLFGNDFGIPQNRERVFVVSIRDDIDSDFSFFNLEKQPLRPLKEFLDEDVVGYDLTQPSMIKSLRQGKTDIVIDSANTITLKQVRWNNAGMVFKDLSLMDKFKDFKKDNKRNGYSLKEVESVIGKISDEDMPKTFRYLTERETWRLTGFTDEDFDKIQHFKKADLYALSGNSIVVQVLEAIFKELLFDKEMI